MVSKPRWLFKDFVVRRLMNDLARRSRSPEDVKEADRPPDTKKKTAKRLPTPVQSQTKKT